MINKNTTIENPITTCLNINHNSFLVSKGFTIRYHKALTVTPNANDKARLIGIGRSAPTEMVPDRITPTTAMITGFLLRTLSLKLSTALNSDLLNSFKIIVLACYRTYEMGGSECSI